MIYILVFLISLQLFISRPLIERVLSLLPFIPLSRWWLALPSFASSQVRCHSILGIITTPHQPTSTLLSVLCPFGQIVHLLFVPRRVEGLDTHVHFCWSRSFFLSLFSLLNIVISPLVLAQLSQVIVSVSFFLKKRSRAHDAQSSALC